MCYSKLISGIGIIVFVLLYTVSGLADTETPGINFTTSAGALDDKTIIWRDDTGIMYFLDNDNTTKTLSNLVTAGVTDHGVLTGLADDDHTNYHTAARHTTVHVAGYNDALAISADTNSNTSIGAHTQDGDIHFRLASQYVVVNKQAGRGHKTTIQSAIDYITDASAAKPYVILVYPGVYNEQITLSKSYISIEGLQPAGADVTEAKSSGVILTHESTGVGTDLMTLDIISSGATNLEGITVANVTIINTASTGVGAYQAAVTVGRGDPYPRLHEVVFKNCSLYGEDRALYVHTGNPVFIDCYIEGESDVVTLEDDAKFQQCTLNSHNSTIEQLISTGKTGDIAFTAEFIGCVFEADTECQVGEWTANNTTTRLYQCVLKPGIYADCWSGGAFTGTIDLWATNGYGWPSDVFYYRQSKLNVGNDTGGTFAVQSNLISGTGNVKFDFSTPDLGYSQVAGFGTSGALQEMYDDLDQTDHSFVRRIKGESGTGAHSSRGTLVEIEHKADTEEDNNDAALLVLRNTALTTPTWSYSPYGDVIQYYLDDVQKFEINKDGDIHTSGTLFASEGTSIGQVVTVAKIGGQYTTIQGAIDSISGSSSGNPYVVLIYPGVYEEQVTLSKSYVSLIGIQPNGAAITEAQNSGVIITYESSGVGDDLMTLWLKGPTVTTDLLGVTLANLTIINTQILGEGVAQEALEIGRGDTYPRAHEILVKNCSLYGEQDTVFVNTGNPVFQDCYIEGENDICSVADDSIFERVQVYSHTSNGARHPIWLGRSGDVAFTVTFTDCIFDKAIPGTSTQGGIGYFSTSNITANFYNCTVMPNCATPFTWDFDNQTACTLNLSNTNGVRWESNMDASSTLNCIAQPPISVVYPGIHKPDIEIIKTRGDELGPRVSLVKRRTVPTNNDEAGAVKFYAQNDSSADKEIAKIHALITDVTATSEDGIIEFYAAIDGTLTKIGSFGPGLNVGTATGAGTGDARLSGDVSIGTDENKAPLQVGATGLASVMAGTVAIFDSEGTITRITILAGGAAGTSVCQYGDDADEDIGAINYQHGTNTFEFRVAGVTRTTINSAGDVNTTGDLEGDYVQTNAHEYLATDIIRHTVTADEATAGSFILAGGWTVATLSKLVSVTTAWKIADSTFFRNQSKCGMGVQIDDAGVVTVYEAVGQAWTVNDVVTVTFLYEK